MSISNRAKKIMHLPAKWVARNKLEGETPPLTFSHLLDGQTYKTDWPAPTRPGADDHVSVTSRGTGS
jgi:hypothetical protein